MSPSSIDENHLGFIHKISNAKICIFDPLPSLKRKLHGFLQVKPYILKKSPHPPLKRYFFCTRSSFNQFLPPLELKNLKELNLSYNMITKLENLDELKRLEILSVFGNGIKKIENIDSLENLIIFSAGNNEIQTTEGVSI